MSKRALGKGLGALIQTDETADTVDSSTSQVPLDKIKPSKDQPRKVFDSDRLDELAESIRKQGVIQPLILEERGSSYAIVAGERRYRAAIIAGLTEVPAIVARYTTEQRLVISLIENLQREDLDPIEEAEAFHRFIERSGSSQDEVGSQIGKSRAYVANSLRLLNLAPEIREAIQSGEISPGHARALLSVSVGPDRERLFQRITSEGLSVRSAEEASRNLTAGGRIVARGKKSESKRPVEVRDIEQRFIEILGTKVNIKGTLEEGTLVISYFSKEDLQRLYDILTGE